MLYILLRNDSVANNNILMAMRNIDKNRSWTNMAAGRNHSPNSFANRNNFNTSNVSVHSDHLWNLMEEVELFPEEIHQLFRYE